MTAIAPAIIQKQSPTVMDIPVFLMESPIFPSQTLHGIPAFCRQMGRKGYILQNWIWNSFAAIESEVHGNATGIRKKYGLLTDTRIREPFIRNDYRE